MEINEHEGRINALRQLLGNTQEQVIQAQEGLLTLAEYGELKAKRAAWKRELMGLTGEKETQAPLAPDVLLETVNNSRVSSIPFVIMAQAEQIDDVTVTENATLFPVWDENWTGRAKSIVQDEGNLYRSIHDVSVGQNTKPSETPAMWTRIGNPAEEWPEWIQPIGAHDAYDADAKVTHNDKRWINTHGSGNVWEPSVYGWKEVI